MHTKNQVLIINITSLLDIWVCRIGPFILRLRTPRITELFFRKEIPWYHENIAPVILQRLGRYHAYTEFAWETSPAWEESCRGVILGMDCGCDII
jgi:hypothetical protein